MSRAAQGSSLFPSHSDDFSAAKSTGNTQPHLSYTINRPDEVPPKYFAEFSQGVSEAVPQANVVLLNENSMQMTWKDGKPAELLRFGDLPKAPTGTFHSLSVTGRCYPDEEQDLTFTTLAFNDSGTRVYEDVLGTQVYDGVSGNKGEGDGSKMVFAPSEPSSTRKTTRDLGSIEIKFGKFWIISTYTPKAGMDAASSNAPGTS